MTLKNYQRIKLGMTFALAIIFSQAILLKNWLIPVALMIVASLVLLYLRRQVKEIIADERDYETGGKAALLSIQIFSWMSAIGMFILYAVKDKNPSYEPVAITLAFSTCILMLLYSVIFRYYNKVKLSDKKLWFSIIVFISFLVMAVTSIRLFSGEDDWICRDGQWVEHGHPDFPAPSIECKK